MSTNELANSYGTGVYCNMEHLWLIKVYCMRPQTKSDSTIESYLPSLFKLISSMLEALDWFIKKSGLIMKFIWILFCHRTQNTCQISKTRRKRSNLYKRVCPPISLAVLSFVRPFFHPHCVFRCAVASLYRVIFLSC